MVKKISARTQAKPLSVRELIERNEWNPFERVDPKILEQLHRQKTSNKKQQLDEYEESPI